MYILGLSCYYHDSAACLIKEGMVVAAASEERFTRKKHDFDFPVNAIHYCLSEAKITARDLDYVVFYDKPFTKFERILLTYLSVAPRGIRSFIKAIPLWLKEKLWVRFDIHKELPEYEGEILFSDHHLSHAASTFLVSPFKEAAIVTVDGVGEWTTSAIGYGKENEIEMIKETRFPHSIGLLYSAITGYLGFKVNSAEYKVMGLAPYGEPKYYDQVRENLIDIKEDGSFKLNMDYFAYTYGLKMFNRKFERLFGVPPRTPESKLEQVHKDIAMSLQKVTEEVVLKMCRHAHKESGGMKHLCLAGGTALNCVANGRVLRETEFEDIFIQPAAGDAGGALGAAYLLYNSVLDKPRNYVLKMPYFGPEFTEEEMKEVLDQYGAVYQRVEKDELVRETAKLLVEQNVVGWFQGRMEFGPRALGSRSILADPRDTKMRDTVNLKIKFRESFRPFAPTVLEDKSSEYFEIDCPSPYMLLTAQVKEDKRVIPSVTHVDGSARLQSVSREANPMYYDVIKEFEKLTGIPVIINTSFNVRGEPIVCTPKDAYLCFMRTHMDYLVLGPFLLDKKEQNPLQEAEDWRKQFVLD